MKNYNATAVKKILMTLAITAMAYAGAVAQTKVTCVKDEKKVCKPSADGGVSCYESKHAQNYKVCKGKSGYFVCCHSPEDVTAYTIHTIDNRYDAYEAAFPDDNGAMAIAATEETTEAGTAAGSSKKQVCRKTADGNTSCYKTEYAKNYKVCKGANGYHICSTPRQ